MDIQKRLKRRWWLKGSSGALLFGSGLSGAIESGFLKNNEVEGILWIFTGTGSLCLVVAGVVFLIEAGISKHELRKMKTNHD